MRLRILAIAFVILASLGMDAQTVTTNACTSGTCVYACAFSAGQPTKCSWLPVATLVGPQGPQGIPGVNGTNGINGTNGTNGQSATIAVGTVTALPPGTKPTVVNSGTPLNAVLNFGLTTGNAGANGMNGTNGKDGPQGSAGPQGPQGLPGPIIPGLSYTVNASTGLTSLLLKGTFTQTAPGTSGLLLTEPTGNYLLGCGGAAVVAPTCTKQ